MKLDSNLLRVLEIYIGVIKNTRSKSGHVMTLLLRILPLNKLLYFSEPQFYL